MMVYIGGGFMNQVKVQNRNGYIGLISGVASIFLYNFLILQLAAIFFSYKGIKDAKQNTLLSKWQSNIGMVLGIMYLFMFFYQFIPKQ
jgi:hypothetical protein